MNLKKLHDGKYWNAKPTTLNGKAAIEFDIGFVNYLNADNEWAEINCVVKESGGVFEMTEAPFECTFPLYADGEAFFNNNNRFDVFKKTLIDCDSLVVTMKALDAAHVQGQLFDINGVGKLDAVLYPQAFPQWDADLIYYVQHGKAPRLQKLIRFNSALSSNIQAEFYLEYLNGTSNDIEISSKVIPNGKTRRQWRDDCRNTLNTPAPVSQDKGFYIRAKDEAQKRGIGIKELKIWDSSLDPDGRKEEAINANIRKSGIGYKLTKHIGKSFFTGATLPCYTDATATFYPDADPETSSVDGNVRRNPGETSWTDLANGNGTVVVDNGASSAVVWRQSVTADKWYYLQRMGLVFDTSPLNGSTVDSATLSGYCFSKSDGISNAGDYAANIYGFAPASDTALVVSDYQTALDTAFSSAIDYANIDAAGYNDFALNANGIAAIDVDGASYFMMRVTIDVTDTAPTHTGSTGNIQSSWYMAEQGGATRPKLVVEYTEVNDGFLFFFGGGSHE